MIVVCSPLRCTLRPTTDGSAPNNWVASFTYDSAWEPDPATGQSYLHLFLKEQPDLNWANPEVEAAMHDTLRFWLDRGVDGFRMDVIHLIGKDPDLADDPDDLAALSHVVLNDRPETHDLLRRIRQWANEEAVSAKQSAQWWRERHEESYDE